MKIKKIAILCGAALSVALAVKAALPTFASKSATGSTSAAVIFPQDPNSQIRVVSASVSSDLTTSTLKFYAGGTAHYLTATNATSATSLQVESTNGIANGALLYIQGATSNVVATVSGFTSPTNVTISAALGIPGLLNAEVEVLSQVNTPFAIGATTNKVFASEGLVVGNFGRALYVLSTGTSWSSLDAVTVHYDSQGQ